ncbi:hypothetical protein E4U55_006310 [Claviceps digitariae]|nr:hypothetical protein E4U55_006310 [Claviceps digitariae]
MHLNSLLVNILLASTASAASLNQASAKDTSRRALEQETVEPNLVKRFFREPCYQIWKTCDGGCKGDTHCKNVCEDQELACLNNHPPQE